MTGQETTAAYAWMRTTLKNGDAIRQALGIPTATPDSVGARIQRFPFRPSSLYPGIGIQLIDAVDFRVIGEDVLFETMVWSVVGVSKGETSAEAAAISKAVFDFLHEMAGAGSDTTSYGQVLSCTSQGAIDYMERDPDGNATWYVGRRLLLRAK